MFISPLKSSLVGKRRGGVTPPFSVNHSMLFDSSYMTIPTADLDPNIFGGTGNEYTIYFHFKLNAINKGQWLLGNNGNQTMIRVDVASSNQIRLITNAGQMLSTKNLVADEWYFVALGVSLDDDSKNYIFIDGIEDTLQLNTTPSSAPVVSLDYEIGRLFNGTNFLDGNLSAFAVVNRLATFQENSDVFHFARPLDIQEYFGVDCKAYINADNSNDTAQFTLTDTINSLTATTTGFITADKTTDNAYKKWIHILGDSFTTQSFLDELKTHLVGSEFDFYSIDGVHGSTLPEQLIRFDATPKYYNSFLVIMDGGLFSQTSQAQAIAAIDGIVDNLVIKKWVWVQPSPSEDIEGSANRIVWNSKTSGIEAHVGTSHYVECLTDLKAGNDGSPNDLQDVSDNIVPRSLRVDTIHETVAGTIIRTNDVAEFIVAQNW